jgi:hypothetical protein
MDGSGKDKQLSTLPYSPNIGLSRDQHLTRNGIAESEASADFGYNGTAYVTR